MMKWRKCSEELPTEDFDENDIECLVKDESENYGIGFWREDAKSWDSCNFGWLETKDRECFGLGKIVAWIPMKEILDLIEN